jgi:formylglycine-generating enzyme required for sulfatase activity
MYKYTHGLLLQIKVSEAYAKWAGKRLPKADEWTAAAGAGKWPWGGSWRTFLYDAKTASQHPFEPTTRDDHVGFRCVEDK